MLGISRRCRIFGVAKNLQSLKARGIEQSYEACCILNASEKDAHIAITIFFEDRNPVGPYKFTIPARRTKHLRFNNFHDSEKISADTPYSSLIESDVPIVVQHTRLDSRQAENALLTTIAFPCG
ncbi:MAG: sensory rhodopsin transducer [Verrucomicrobia bacterium]|nr:MAG: sensory rhodopsin transducer [Verrucomicrobiota bacterium]